MKGLNQEDQVDLWIFSFLQTYPHSMTGIWKWEPIFVGGKSESYVPCFSACQPGSASVTPVKKVLIQS